MRFGGGGREVNVLHSDFGEVGDWGVLVEGGEEEEEEERTDHRCAR